MDNKFSRYTDPTGSVTTSQLRLGGWYVRHKILLQKLWIIFMIAFSSVTIGYSFWKWGEYLFVGYGEDRRILLVGQANEFQNYTAIQAAYKAQELNVTNVQTFQSGKESFDFAAMVANVNKRWIAELSYHFAYTGGETEVEKTIILPGQKRPAIAFGHELNVFPANVRFFIDKITWKVIDTHKINDVSGFMNPRLDFAVGNFIFNNVNPTGLNIASATFDLTNRTAYSYWQPVFYLELLNDNLPVGYMFISVDNFLSGETKKIDLRYFGSNITVTNFRLIPIINVFDPDIYIEPEK